jgi:MFS family permease
LRGARYYFDWDVPESGLFLSILGLLMFPANAVIAILSSRWEDREIMLPTQVIVLVGSLGIIAYSQENYSAIQYIVFGLCIFLGTNMLEAPTMSLLSKTIPRRWAKGTWNSGLLATEAGTLGRAIGDVMVSSAGLVGLERMLELTYAPVSVAVVLLIIFTWRLFPLLEPDDEDDD